MQTISRYPLVKLLIVLLVVRASYAFSQEGGDKVYEVGKGIRAPKPVGVCKPDFSSLDVHEIKGQVVMTIVVAADGSVSHVKVEKGLGREINEAVAKAVGNCRFEPAIREKDKQQVTVRMRFEFNFKVGPS